MVLDVIVPIFSMILVGIIIGRFKKIKIDIFVDLVLYITAPALILSYIVKSQIAFTEFLLIFGIAALILITIGFLAYLALRLTGKKKHLGLILPMTWGNTGNIGFPVALFAFGSAGLSRAIAYDMASALLIFSVGVFIVHKNNSIKEAFKLPLIYATALGLLLNYLNITFPIMVDRPLETIGLITIPLSLLILGYKLASIKIKSIKTAIFASLFRIIVGFLIGFVFINLFGIQDLNANILQLQAAMPSAVMSLVLCEKYKRDADLVAPVVLISVLISVISIPLILSIL